MSEDHQDYNLMFVNVETAQEAFKPLHFFLEGVGAPDGWPDCQSALETRRRIMSSEMRWCVVSIYLTGAQLHPHSPTGKVYCMTPVSHSLPYSLALQSAHVQLHSSFPAVTVPAHARTPAQV